MACCRSRSGSPGPIRDWYYRPTLIESQPSSPAPFLSFWFDMKDLSSASFGQIPHLPDLRVMEWTDVQDQTSTADIDCRQLLLQLQADGRHQTRSPPAADLRSYNSPNGALWLQCDGQSPWVGRGICGIQNLLANPGDLVRLVHVKRHGHEYSNEPRLSDTITVDAFRDPQLCGQLPALVEMCSTEDLAKTLVSLQDDIRDMCWQLTTMYVDKHGAKYIDKHGKTQSVDKHDEAKSRFVQAVIKKGCREPVKSELGSQVQEIVDMFLVLPAAFHIHFHHILVAIFGYFPCGRLSKNIVDAFEGNLGEMARNGTACRVVNAMMKYQSDQPVNNMIKEELLKLGESGALAEHKVAHWVMQEIVLKGHQEHLDILYRGLKAQLPDAIAECRKAILYVVQFLLEHAAGPLYSDWKDRLRELGDELNRLPATNQALRLLSGEGERERERELSLMADAEERRRMIGESSEDFLSSEVLTSLEENDREHFKSVISVKNDRTKFAEHLQNIMTALQSREKCLEQVLRWQDERREAERRRAERRGRQ